MLRTNFNYTITVTNLGPGAAANLSVTDNLPSVVSVSSARQRVPSPTAASCLDQSRFARGGRGDEFDRDRDRARQRRNSDQRRQRRQPDERPEPDEQHQLPVFTSVTPVADLAIGKTAPAGVAAAGNLTYTISVTNFGPSSASSVVVTDALPAGVTFVNASGNGVNNSGVVSWILGDLANGQASNVTVTVTAPASGTLTNVASVSSPTATPICWTT